MAVEEAANTAKATHTLRSSKRERTCSDTALAVQAPKKKKVKNSKSDEDRDLDLENSVNTAIGRLDRHLLADYVALKSQQFEKNLSLIELEEKYIPGTLLGDLSANRGISVR